jgi:serine protease DegQ
VTRRRTATGIGALALAALLAACSPGEGFGSGSDTEPSPDAAPPVAAALDVPELVRELEPSVVTVFPERGVGSGVVYREDGLLVTNAHVVGDAQEVGIGFADGQRLRGEVVATDALVDLALVRVDREDLPAPEYRTELPEVGETVIVIGSPLGFEGSVTSGIVSGLHRDIPGSAAAGTQALVDLIQTDAAISPGNSGGAVIDAEGRVVGLSEAYIPPAAGAVALGFAIPADTVVRVADELLEDGRAEHAYLGVQFGRLTPQIAQELGVDREGALVLAVGRGGPADVAGVEPGDVVVAVDGERVRRTEDVLSALRRASPGDRLTLAVLRGDEEVELEVLVVDRPV